MIQVEYRLKMGQDEFIIRAEVKNEKEFFQKMAFYSSLPKSAPGGATDLKLVVRETKKGTYYSLVSESEKLEFQLGQHKEGDTLYAKEWVPLYQADQEEQPQTQQRTAPLIGAAPQQARPAVQTPVSAPSQMPIPQTVTNPVAAAPISPTPAATPPTPVAPANPQVAAVANNVLARFGINK